MNVLFVSSFYAPYYDRGGPAIVTQKLAEGMIRKGHRVTVLTVDREPRSSTHAEWMNGVRVIYLKTWLQYRSSTVNPGAIEYCLRSTRKFDVVYIAGFYDSLGPIAAMVCRALRRPFVVEPMGSFRPLLRSLRKKQAFLTLFGGSLFHAPARVVASSEQERDELIDVGVKANLILVRRNGIDLEEFSRLPEPGRFRDRHGIEPREPITMFLGRLTLKKHPEILLESFARTNAAGRLVFVGPDDDGYTQRLQRLAETLGLGARVLLTGPLVGPARLEALVDADIFVLPSENENFGIAVAEAMACNTPVIVTDRCGIAPFVQGGGIVVSFSADAIDEPLRRLLGDPELRRNVGDVASHQADRLGWEEPLASTEELFLTFAEGTTPAGASTTASTWQ
jgi:glycosyltransferase involved in cell wall biosynthesis